MLPHWKSDSAPLQHANLECLMNGKLSRWPQVYTGKDRVSNKQILRGELETYQELYNSILRLLPPWFRYHRRWLGGCLDRSCTVAHHILWMPWCAYRIEWSTVWTRRCYFRAEKLKCCTSQSRWVVESLWWGGWGVQDCREVEDLYMS